MVDILIVDDEEKICFAFSECVKELGHYPHTASGGRDAMVIFNEVQPVIVFLDIRLPGQSGLELLEKMKQLHPDVAVVIMTAFGTMDTAIEAVKKGAYDYLTKPLSLHQIEALIKRILRPRDSGSVTFIPQFGSLQASDTIIGNTEAIADIYKMIGLLTTNDVPVLIEGESGTGKELVARAIHNRSERKDAPFVAINCGAMPYDLLETELFGHEKGAFTGADSKKIGKFEYAGRGTVFLDEIGDLKLPLQIKLLRVLQEKNFVRVGGLETLPVEARIITATNRNLFDEMNIGRFRSDLYYRLQLITLKLPPLRARRDDIPTLASYFIHKTNLEMGKTIRGIESDAMDILMNHSWPGNVRELENVIKRAMIVARGETIGAHALELKKIPKEKSENKISLDSIAATVRMWFEQRDAFGEESLFSTIMGIVEKNLILQALKACNHNQVKASELLSMNRTTLRNKIKEYGE